MTSLDRPLPRLATGAAQKFPLVTQARSWLERILSVAGDAVAVSVEAVWVCPDALELLCTHLGAVEVWRVWRDTGTDVVGVAVATAAAGGWFGCWWGEGLTEVVACLPEATIGGSGLLFGRLHDVYVGVVRS